MTDRIKGLVVVLGDDYRDDDVESIVNAILMIKGVVAVNKKVVNMDDYINRIKIRGDLEKRLLNILREEKV